MGEDQEKIRQANKDSVAAMNAFHEAGNTISSAFDAAFVKLINDNIGFYRNIN